MNSKSLSMNLLIYSLFKELSPTNHTTNTALIFDAVMLLADTLKQLESSHFESPDSMINCYDPYSTWSKGSTLLNFMKGVRKTLQLDIWIFHCVLLNWIVFVQNNYTGLSGLIEFDKGVRSNVKIEILGLKSERFKVVGWYKPTDGIVPVPSSEARLLLLITPKHSESNVLVDFFSETGGRFRRWWCTNQWKEI